MASFSEPKTPWLVVALRVVLSLILSAGVTLVTYLLVLELPPETKIAISLMVLGALMLFTAVVGLISSSQGKCCCITNTVLSVVTIFAQLAMAILFHAKQDLTVEQFAEYKKYNEDRVDMFVKVIKWFLAGCACAQLLALILAILSKCCLSRDPEYESMDLEQRREIRRKEALDSLKEDRMKAEEKMDSKNNRLAERMRQKYGRYTGGGDDEWDETRSGGIGRGRTAGGNTNWDSRL